MKIKRLNESVISELNSLPAERGISKVSYDLVQQYKQVLKKFPVGTVLKHVIDAGEEMFTKIESGDVVSFWEHFRAPWKDTKKITEFDMARWLAGRAVISRSDIIKVEE